MLGRVEMGENVYEYRKPSWNAGVYLETLCDVMSIREIWLKVKCFHVASLWTMYEQFSFTTVGGFVHCTLAKSNKICHNFGLK